MKLENILAVANLELWFKPVLPESQPLPGLAKFRFSSKTGEYNIVQNTAITTVTISNRHEQGNLDNYLTKGSACLAKVLQIAADGSTLLYIVFFNGPLLEWSPIDVGVDDRIVETAEKYGFSTNKIELLADELGESCLLDSGSTLLNSYFVIVSGHAVEREIETDDEENISIIESVPSIFEIQGDNLRIPVERHTGDKLLANRIAPRVVNASDPALQLVQGGLSFSDFTKTGGMGAEARGQMSEIIKQEGSYLKRWDEYGSLEGKLLLEKARGVGKLRFRNVELATNGVQFFFDEALPDSIAEGLELELTSVEPPYIRNPELSWQEYSQYLEQEYLQQQPWSKKNRSKDQAIHAKILAVKSRSIILESSDARKIQTDGFTNEFLILSINGDKTQIERRMKARRQILEGRSANPQLGLIIEEGSKISGIRRTQTLKELTTDVWKKIFPKETPTPVQREAIRLALNTPDIMLIQGPPGTGKTKVITAIIERLNEEHDKSKSIKGQVLVTAFQHDAVENMLSRLSINALPHIKFGSKTDKSDFTPDRTAAKIKRYCEKIVSEMTTKYPHLLQTRDQARLAEHISIYSTSPSKANARNIIEAILELPGNVLTKDLRLMGNHLLISLESQVSTFSDESEKLKIIRSLRIREAAFLDDGSFGAAAILDQFYDELTDSERFILQKASLWGGESSPDFLVELKALKEILLERYTPLPTFQIEKAREDILAFFDQVNNLLIQKRNIKDKEEYFLAMFLQELEDNPHGVRVAIEDYNYVFAATTQQSDGSSIKKAKAKNDPLEVDSYDTVIIDEAARVSPRDLLIPMVKAKKRIILVGDHRQLPHIIDEAIIQALQDDDDQALSEDDYVRESMFGYLKKRLEKLKDVDGFQRVITLDAQYRTHPLLGDFISNHFYYEPVGENAFDERFKSPLPEESFAHDLPGTQGAAAVWLDVSKGDEIKDGRSTKRPSEAKAIADQIAIWLDSEAGRELSFGVISFYSAQVNEIFKALKTKGLAIKTDDNHYEVADEYALFEKSDKERLRVGTVDAFQGMEFDVVFLSMVRSQDIHNLPPRLRRIKDEALLARNLFGHLVSKNRLCVSMSRQKKLLVLVGNAKYAQSKLARKAVPALGDFYDLCQKNGVVYGP